MRRIVRGAGLAFGITALMIAPAPAQQPKGPAGTRKPAAPAAAPATKGAGQPAAKSAPRPLPDQAPLADILRQWEQRSGGTRTLYTKFTREDFAADWQTVTLYEGTALLQAPDRAYLDFQKVDDTTRAKAFSERIVATGNRIYHFVADVKTVDVYGLAQDQKQKAMEEGPLPFLFNMKADDALKRYRILLLDQNAEKWLISIEPREPVDREAFSRAFVTLDRTKLEPVQIKLVDPANAKNTKTYKLGPIQRDAEIKPDFFDGQKQATEVARKGWNVVMHPPGEAAAGAPRAARQPVGPVIPRPAMQPRTRPRR